jgi:subtilisin-like proprotein convertase family protein
MFTKRFFLTGGILIFLFLFVFLSLATAKSYGLSLQESASNNDFSPGEPLSSGSTPLPHSILAVQCQAPALPIPNYDQYGITSTMVIDSAETITDLNVSIDTTHTFVGDLEFSLKHEETGTSVMIIDRPGYPATLAGCSGNDILAILDDEALNPVENQCAPGVPTINGTFIPNNPLSVFDGESLNGTWKLTVIDSAPEDVGTLNEWCLFSNDTVITPTPSNTPTPTMTPSVTPGPLDFWLYLPIILK